MQTFVGNLNDEVEIDFFRMEVVHQLPCSLGGTTCCQQVVMNQYNIIGSDGVDMHFNGVNAIFFRELFLDDGGGKLTGFSGQNNAATQSSGQSRSHDETAAFNSYNLSDTLVFVEFIKFVQHNLHALGTFVQRGHVSEVDTFLWKIRNASQILN